MRVFFSSSYFASLAYRAIVLASERPGATATAGKVVAAMLVSPVRMIGVVVLCQRQERLFQACFGNFQVAEPGVAPQKLAHYRLCGVHLQLERVTVGLGAQDARNLPDLFERQPAGAADLFAHGARLDFSGRAL